MKRKLYSILLVLMASMGLAAQNSTASPASRYGFGDLNDVVPGTYRAMGGVTTGMRNHSVINPSQPASYTACDSMTFMFNMAAGLGWDNYRDASGKHNKAVANLEYITLQFPIWRQHIAFSAGVVPYTQMGYEFALEGNSGGHAYDVSYYGEGGITQLYGGLSFNICDWVALGANFYYMFGHVNNLTALTFTESPLYATTMIRNLDISAFRFRYGAQFFHTFAKKHTVVLGGVFENKRKMGAEYFQYEVVTADTVNSRSNFESPMSFGAGLSYTYNERLTLAADYSCQYWSKALYFGDTNRLSDRHKLTIGAEYRHNPMGRNYAERMYWRVGFNTTNSYVSAIDKNDFGVSLGLGFPLRTSMTMFNVIVEYNRLQSMPGLTENLLKMTLDVSISESWFRKRKL